MRIALCAYHSHICFTLILSAGTPDLPSDTYNDSEYNFSQQLIILYKTSSSMSLIKGFPTTPSLLRHGLLIRKSPRHVIQTFVHVRAYTHYHHPHLAIWKYHSSPRSNWLICWVCPLNVPCSPDTCELHLEAFRAFFFLEMTLSGKVFQRTSLTTESSNQEQTLFL